MEERKDTISRQAAIDAARKCRVIEVTPAYMLIDKAEMMMELMCLPSAQPEWSEPLVICDNCGHAITVRKDDASAWKPYHDGDDIPDGRYLVQAADGEMHTGTMTGFGWIFGHYVPPVVAYRELPEKYVEE